MLRLLRLTNGAKESAARIAINRKWAGKEEKKVKGYSINRWRWKMDLRQYKRVMRDLASIAGEPMVIQLLIARTALRKRGPSQGRMAKPNTNI